MSKKSSPRRLRPKGVQALLRESEWVLEPELTAQIPNGLYISSIYTSSDGRVLVVLSDGAGNIFESTEAWLSQLRSLESLSNQGPIHLLHGRLPQGRQFIDEVPQLIRELPVNLDILPEQLDKRESSLEAIDQAVRRKGKRRCLESNIFAPLVAYVGEVIKEQVNGRWEIRATSDPEVWEPWILDEQDHDYAPFIIVYDELYESIGCSIYGAVSGLLRAHLFGNEHV